MTDTAAGEEPTLIEQFEAEHPEAMAQARREVAEQDRARSPRVRTTAAGPTPSELQAAPGLAVGRITTAAPWPLGTYVPYTLCGALPPKWYIQQFCLVRKDHVENGHPHQNYGGLIWSDTEATDGT